jgi:hypothetical protein
MKGNMCNLNVGAMKISSHTTQIVAHVRASFATNIALVSSDGCDTLQNVPIFHVHGRK